MVNSDGSNPRLLKLVLANVPLMVPPVVLRMVYVRGPFARY